ncbi:MAG TPA: hypothetical protein PKA64_17340, partial [Myxococcota bacterium]|nr:hypothetical protein [Myxococcota bacterium]
MRRALLALDLHDDATPTLAAAAPIAERLGLTLDLVWVDRHEAAAAMSRYTTLTLQLAEARAALHAQDALRLRAMLAGLPAACRGEALALDGE